MCRFATRDLVAFAGGFTAFAAVAIIGMLSGGQGFYLIGWLAYGVFFLFIWEARVLCSHCPFWAGEGRILRCHANYGVIKIWKFDPRPMNSWEKAQFIGATLIFIGYPFPFLIMGGKYGLTAVALLAGALAAAALWTRACSRCVHFSCPLNHAPDPLVEAYLEKNPMMSR
jgi:hypothetical protein